MKLTNSQIKKLNKLSKKKPIMVRVNQNWYTWAEGDPKYGVFLTTQSGDDVEFDFKQIDDIQESKMVKMKSKLREMIREEIQKLNEGSMGKFGKDESDVFGGIVRMNKKKKPKDILKIVSKDKFLAKNIKRMRISNQELLDYIEDELEFFQFS